MKYVVALFLFSISFIGVAIVVGLGMILLLRPEGDVTVGIGHELYNLPGTLLGLYAGVCAWRFSLKKSKGRSDAGQT